MTSEEKEMWNNIEKLSELRAGYSCFDEKEEPFYHALSLGIKGIKALNVLDKIREEIKPKCDRINSLASILSYTAHREIQELLCEIMDLCKAESEGKE